MLAALMHALTSRKLVSGQHYMYVVSVVLR